MDQNNTMSGNKKISTEELQQMKNVINFTFKSNYKQIKQSDYYKELPPSVQKRLLSYIVQEEIVRFKHLFSRSLSN
jgi:hypothetical protein